MKYLGIMIGVGSCVLSVGLCGCAGPAAERASTGEQGDAGVPGDVASSAKDAAPAGSTVDARIADGGARDGVAGTDARGPDDSSAKVDTSPSKPVDSGPPPANALLTVDVDGVPSTFRIAHLFLHNFGMANLLEIEAYQIGHGNTLVLAGKGGKAGTFPCGPDWYFSLVMANKGTYSTPAPGGTCTITLDSWGLVGSSLTGSFSGTAPAIIGAVTGTKTFVNGKVSAIRAKDVE
jgi:hypothetical protein